MPTHFRALENHGNSDRKDEILRAAISAFVALSKPVRRDINQIEDLVLPILPNASVAAKRFACAALSDSAFAPIALVKTLCAEAADICAPLLLKSPILLPVDLVSIIGRYGKSHARIISCRTHLPNDVVEALALVDDDVVRDRISETKSDNGIHNIKPSNAEEARRTLMEMAMAIAEQHNALARPEQIQHNLPAQEGHAEKLIRLALREKPELFATALADGLGLTVDRCLRIMRRSGSGELLAGLKSLRLSTDQAFVVMCALNPIVAASKADIRLFRDRFDALDMEKAVEMVRLWKSDEIALEFVKAASNGQSETGVPAILKAS